MAMRSYAMNFVQFELCESFIYFEVVSNHGIIENMLLMCLSLIHVNMQRKEL